MSNFIQKLNTMEDDFRPSITMFRQINRSGVHNIDLNQSLMGYVVSGTKIIYHSDRKTEAKAGDIFYLPPTVHYVEEIPDGDIPFEQITLSFSNMHMAKMVTSFLTSLDIPLEMDKTPAERSSGNLSIKAWGTLRSYFNSLKVYLKDDIFIRHRDMEMIRLAELVYLILSYGDSPIRKRLLDTLDRVADPFEQIVRDNIFTNASLDDMAAMTSKSLTAFKNEFKRVFKETPHRWLIKQRLLYSKLLVISTTKPISEIGYECRFDNASHFIKLFKREFGMTPLTMRAMHQ